jgi:hypothetical protein
VVILSWGLVEDCEAAPHIAMLGSLLPSPPPGAPGPFALAEPGASSRSWPARRA